MAFTTLLLQHRAMKKILLLSVILPVSVIAFAQFKNDNVLYRTIFPQYLCDELKNSKGYLLLDVRSKGEYEDTSSAAVYNLGHLQNAVNINVRELGNRLPEIAAYKNKPVYVYCSHSQRSRRASKMLSDSGFTNIINVNGGVTAFRQLPEENCLNKLLLTNVGYKIISARALCEKLSGNRSKLFLLDVRSDSAFRHIDKAANVNALGSFKNSVNIPLAELKKRIAEVSLDKEIIVIDLFGDDAAKASAMLYENNYRNVSMLLEGVDRIFFTDSRELTCLQSSYNSPVKYRLLSTPDFDRFMKEHPDYLALDIRPAEEFNNKAKDFWKNIGHLQHAVNIPVDQLATNTGSIEKFKNKPVVLYAFSGNPEVHEAANILMSKGFTNVSVLTGGIFNIRWTAGNVEGYSALSKLLADVPAENQ